jgi:NAD-dependent dihydropyrimidine dehydrogenase PreA subunit
MAWEISREKCVRCGACVSVCPKLSLDLKEKGVEHDKGTCILCGICQRMCPAGAIKVDRVEG